MEKFLQKFNIIWTKTEITIMFNWKIKTIKIEEIDKYKSIANIYFLPWVRPDLEDWKRANDRDIVAKKSFTIDIDLRNQLQTTISNMEIVQEGLAFAQLLWEHHKLFWQWSYINFTGNWLHIYYIWKETTFTPKQYKMWVKYIYKMWDDFWNDMWANEFRSDHACCNIWRILRVPWTINQKNGWTVRILAEQEVESELFNNIKLFACITWYDEIIEAQILQKQLLKKQYSTDGDDLYHKINSIPAYTIAQILLPEFPFDKNWKNFKNKKWWFCWYFYDKNTNSICNWGSRYFAYWDSNSCFAPFQLIQKWHNFSNAETFKYFKEHFNL